jgi:hypothetical protein
METATGDRFGLQCMVGQTAVSSVRIPIAPPAWPQPSILCTRLLAISPVLAAISDLNSGPPIDGVGSFFSEWLISLRGSGLRKFGTVLEIRVFQDVYEF